MHLWRLLIGALFLAAFAAGAAVVYKWVDADGMVHFSDQPVPGAERIVTAGSVTNGISVGASDPGTPSGAQSRTSAAPAFAIESPAKDQVFFGDDVVSVRLHAEPGPQGTQSIVWTLNGTALTDQPPGARSFALPTLPRGTYVLTATMTGSAGAPQMSDSVTFYVRQPSELSPQHKKS